jgi:hypothetical protein
MFEVRRSRLTILVLIALAIAGAAGVSKASGQTSTQVVVPRGQPVQLAFTSDTTEFQLFTDFTGSARNAIHGD